MWRVCGRVGGHGAFHILEKKLIAIRYCSDKISLLPTPHHNTNSFSCLSNLTKPSNSPRYKAPIYKMSTPAPIPAQPQSQSTTTTPPFQFPPTYSFPPFFTPQPNTTTRHSQLQKWSSLIQSWCRHHRIYRLSVIDAIDSPLFHNTALRKRVSLSEARAILDFMARGEEDGGGGRRAEWIDSGSKSAAWIWWRRPEEWAGLLVDWVSFFYLVAWFAGGWARLMLAGLG